MARRLRRGALTFAVAAVLLAALGLPLASPIARAADAGAALGYARTLGPHAATVPFTVNATDAPAFTPSTLTGAQAGDNVSVWVHNLGALPHTFTVVPVPNYAFPSSISPAALNAWFAANGSLANLSLAPGGSGWANFTLPASSAGASFEFLSVVPYQFQAGMSGTLQVAVGGPSAVLSVQSTTSFQFLPNILVANATSFPIALEVKVTNVGSLYHTFTLDPLPGVFLSPSNFTSFFQAHPPLVDLQVPAQDGAQVNGTFVIDHAGVYEFLCEAPGHFANGMNGTLWVGIAPPPAAAPLSTAIVSIGVLAGVAALLLAGTLLALAASYVGRFPRAPPGAGHP